MANQYLVAQKLLSTGAHLSRSSGAAEHFKSFLSGHRNGLHVIDSDKTAVALRCAVSFLSSLIRRGGRVFFLRTRNDLKDDVLEHMAARLSCAHDTQMGLPGFSTNTPGLRRNPSRKVRFSFSAGPHSKPDCFVILGSESEERKAAAIQEAYRSHIPTVCLVDSAMPLDCYRRITYPVPAVDTPQFVYLFCNLVAKSVVADRREDGK